MILDEETYKKFGYYPSDWKPHSNKKIIAKCDRCSKIREVRKGDYSTFCFSCAHKGENNINWQGGRIERKCIECGKTFFVKHSAIKRGGGKYCSCVCMGKSYSKNRKGEKSYNWKGGKIKRICLACGKEFETYPLTFKKFCCFSCASMGGNNPNWKGGPIKRKCKECGQTFYARRNVVKQGNGKYCSHSCSNKEVRRNQKFSKRPTNPETVFEKLCKKNNLPFHYVGDSKLWISKNPSLNPDFTENNGKKIAIFINGDYWHSPLLRYNIRDSQRADVQIRICKRHKWKPIIIWESDLLREDAEAFVLTTLKKEKAI